MTKKKDNKKKPEVHEELKGFDIKINEFGEIVSNVNVDKINSFLDENVEDKKLNEKAEKENDSQEEE